MSDDADVRPEDALQVAQRALAKVNDLEGELESLEQKAGDLEEDLTAATLRLSEFDEDREYDQLTRDDKIGMVREHAFRRANDNGGRAALDYDDIRWSVFDGGPSPAHCYDLMKWASDARGFQHQRPDNGNERLSVNAEEAKRGRAFYSAKKDASEEVA